ncbi:MAG: DUF1616 domain-containing protein [Chloroflexota bacterium]
MVENQRIRRFLRNFTARSTTTEAITVLFGGLIQLYLIAADAGGLLGIVRLLLGLMFIVAVPGYFIQAALFPRQGSISSIERLALAVGLSLALLPPATLIIDHMTFLALDSQTIIGTMALIIVSVAVVSWWRRAQVDDPFHPGLSIDVGTWWASETTTGRTAYFAIGFSLFIAVIVGLVMLFTPTPAERFTEFYLTNTEGEPFDFPREVNVGEPIEFIFGITNFEEGMVDYYVEIFSNEAPLDRLGPFSLTHEENIEVPVSTIAEVAADTRLTLRLYREQSAEPYRQLLLWVSVVQPLQ